MLNYVFFFCLSIQHEYVAFLYPFQTDFHYEPDSVMLKLILEVVNYKSQVKV